MSRIDKYDPVSGGSRFKLTAALVLADVGKIRAVSIATGTGRVTIGGGAATDLNGIICPVRPMAAGEPIDVMRSGEIAEATETAGTAFTAGARVYGHPDGTVDDTATTGKLVGFTTDQVNRLVVALPLT
jgi:hypothetical protein